MSSHHRPARRRTAARPISTSIPTSLPETAASQTAVEAVPAPVPVEAEAPASSVQDWLREHAIRMTELVDRARRVAEGRLDHMEQRQRRGEEVYPREFDQVCRGLQLLARCGYELARLVNTALKVEGAAARAGQTLARTEQQAASVRFNAELAQFEQLVKLLPQE